MVCIYLFLQGIYFLFLAIKINYRASAGKQRNKTAIRETGLRAETQGRFQITNTFNINLNSFYLAAFVEVQEQGLVF